MTEENKMLSDFSRAENERMHKEKFYDIVEIMRIEDELLSDINLKKNSSFKNARIFRNDFKYRKVVL